MTAYFGLFDIGKPKAGETLVVSGAAGAVGSLVCQLGVLKGLTVYATAGSDDKCRWLERELGVKKAFNYKDKGIWANLKRDVGTFDVYFDNVGGEMLNFMLTRMNKFARIVVCGAPLPRRPALADDRHRRHLGLQCVPALALVPLTRRAQTTRTRRASRAT